MSDALADHEGSVSIGSTVIPLIRPADDIAGIARQKEGVDRSSRQNFMAYKVEIVPGKT